MGVQKYDLMSPLIVLSLSKWPGEGWGVPLVLWEEIQYTGLSQDGMELDISVMENVVLKARKIQHASSPNEQRNGRKGHSCSVTRQYVSTLPTHPSFAMAIYTDTNRLIPVAIYTDTNRLIPVQRSVRSLSLRVSLQGNIFRPYPIRPGFAVTI